MPGAQQNSSSSSESDDDSDDFASVRGDEPSMLDVASPASQRISPAPEPALSPSAIDESLAAQMEALEADLRQQQLDLEYRRRFLSLRPVFRGIFKMFSSADGAGAGSGVDGGVEPSTLEGLAKTLFPQSRSSALSGSAGAALVPWADFIAFAETAEHIPRDDSEWEQLCVPLRILLQTACHAFFRLS